jgi:hypothetical protein
MTREPEELDEARLQALFDRTAELPSGPTLTKLSARAADVPARTKQRPWWQSLGFGLPAAAVVAGAVAVLALPELRSGGPTERAPIARTAETPPPAATEAVKPLPIEELDEPETAVFADEMLAEMGAEDDLALYGPESDEDLDAWLDATQAMLDEGG